MGMLCIHAHNAIRGMGMPARRCPRHSNGASNNLPGGCVVFWNLGVPDNLPRNRAFSEFPSVMLCCFGFYDLQTVLQWVPNQPQVYARSMSSYCLSTPCCYNNHMFQPTSTYPKHYKIPQGIGSILRCMETIWESKFQNTTKALRELVESSVSTRVWGLRSEVKPDMVMRFKVRSLKSEV